MDLAAAVDELYHLPPADFTGRRDELAGQAKKDGDAALSKEIKALRRPTAAAALLNRLARDHADTLEDYLQIGEQLREAQANLSGDDLRTLTQERQRAAAALVKRAVALSDGPVSAAVRGELDATLVAAVADPAAGQALASGAMTRSLSYAGFGEVDVSDATAAPSRPVRAPAGARKPAAQSARAGAHRKAEPAPHKPDRTAVLAQRREESDHRVAEAEAAVTAAQQAVQASVQAELDAERAQQQAEADVERLRDELTKARFAARAAQQQIATVHADRLAAEKAVTSAEKVRDRLRKQRDLLRED